MKIEALFILQQLTVSQRVFIIQPAYFALEPYTEIIYYLSTRRLKGATTFLLNAVKLPR
jgi:hypothetical protein